jgi:nucleoid DNA-binding protein
LTELIQDELAGGGEVSLPGIGKFSTSERKARTGRNPKTGEPIEIAARRVPKFKAGKQLKIKVTE